MSSIDIQTLIRRYVDDPETLSEDEWATLVDYLSQHQEEVVALREELLLAEMLSEQNAVDRQGFPNQVAHRIRESRRRERDHFEDAVELRTMAWEDAQRQRDDLPEKTRLLFPFYLVPLVFLAAILGWWFAQVPGQLGVYTVAMGTCEFQTTDGWKAIRPDQPIRNGDVLRTQDAGELVVSYVDGTKVTLRRDSMMEVTTASGAKRVFLRRGELRSQIAPQPTSRAMVFSTSHARATIVGTEITLTANQFSTRLDVHSGRVTFDRLANPSGKPIVVSANQRALATERILRAFNRPDRSRSEGIVWRLQVAEDGPQLIQQNAVMEHLTVEASGAVEYQDNELRLSPGVVVLNVPPQNTAKQDEFTITCGLSAERVIDEPDPILQILDSDEQSQLAILHSEAGLIVRLSSDPVSPALPIMLGQPHQITISCTPGKLTIYIDGEVSYDTNSSGAVARLASCSRIILGGKTWQGTISDVTLYDRPVGKDEAAELSHTSAQ